MGIKIHDTYLDTQYHILWRLEMALPIKEYETVSLKGSKVQHLKRNKNDYQKFIFDFTKNSKRYRQTYIAPKDTPTGMIRMARIKCEAFYQQAGRVRSSLDTNITVDIYWDRFCEHKKYDWSKNHASHIKGVYKNYVKAFIGKKQLRRVHNADIDDIMDKAKQTLGKRSQKSILEILKPLFQRAIKEKLILDSPVDQDIKRNAAEEKKIVLGAEEKFKKVHKAIHNTFNNNPKLKAAFLLGFNGRRFSEVLTLKWSDINFDNNTYRIQAKNNKLNIDMTFGLNEELTIALKEVHEQKDSIWVFSSNRDPLKHMTKLAPYYVKIREASGIKEFTFHWMRNLLVSALAGKEGVDISDLSALLGHNDAGTLKKYLSLQREQSSQKAAIAIDRMLT